MSERVGFEKSTLSPPDRFFRKRVETPFAVASLDVKAYEIFKATLGAEGAEEVIECIESKVEKSLEHNQRNLATKQDLAELETRLTKAIVINGLIQFLAIGGSVLAILNGVKK